MPKADRLKDFIEKTDNFGKYIKDAAERLEDRIVSGKAKYFLEPIPGIGDYIWSRAMGESKDDSIGCATIAGPVRGIMYALTLYAGSLSGAAIPVVIDILKETSTFLQFRKSKIKLQEMTEENWKQMDVTYG